MITTLLLDLDDTLLGNDLGTFLPAYFSQLARYLPAEADRQQIIGDVMAATQAMIVQPEPSRVLFDVFSECFTLRTGWPAATWRPIFDRLYAEGYRELQALTTRRPAARALVEWAFSQGYEVAIATSPLFPEAALRQRLRWAGVDDFPYAVVTSVETSHYSKPRPEYFGELLAMLGRRPGQALMAGNDWENDIVAASAAGIPTFWITPEGHPTDSPLPGDAQAAPRLGQVAARPVGTGTLEDFLRWAQANLPALPETPPSPTALPYLLAGHLAHFWGQLADVPAGGWKRRPAPDEWSATEIVCHLRDVEREVHLPRLHAVVESDNPFIAGADTDPWAAERNYQAEDGPAALEAFSQARQATTRFLGGLPASAWSRTARHAIFGPTQLAEIVGWTLDHDRIHLAQIKEVLNGRPAPGSAQAPAAGS